MPGVEATPASDATLTRWPPPRGQHPGDGLAAQLEGGDEVQLDLVGDLLAGRVPERGAVVEAGVVDEHVDRPGLVLHPVR